jgi:hypothetical protein
MRTITADRLRVANNESEVVELVRDYMRDWLPEEIGRLPTSCRPGKLRDAEDLSVLALNLTLASVTFDQVPADLHLIEEMDAFVGQACKRIAEIQGAAMPRRVATQRSHTQA